MRILKSIALASALCLTLTACNAGSDPAGDTSGSGASGQNASTDSSISDKAAGGQPDSSNTQPGLEKVPGVWPMVLVNTDHPLSESYDPPLEVVQGEKQFDARAASHFKDMLKAAEKDGIMLYVVSTYRTITYQKNLFEKDVKKYMAQGMSREAAEQETAKNIAIPGTSEHNLGLAADIVSSDWYHTHDDLTEDFEDTPAFDWLSANADKYGFILRYPKGKESVTKIVYEPWHYRYVGVENAAVIKKSGLCLEEYMEKR